MDLSPLGNVLDLDAVIGVRRSWDGSSLAAIDGHGTVATMPTDDDDPAAVALVTDLEVDGLIGIALSPDGGTVMTVTSADPTAGGGQRSVTTLHDASGSTPAMTIGRRRSTTSPYGGWRSRRSGEVWRQHRTAQRSDALSPGDTLR